MNDAGRSKEPAQAGEYDEPDHAGLGQSPEIAPMRRHVGGLADGQDTHLTIQLLNGFGHFTQYPNGKPLSDREGLQAGSGIVPSPAH
ncbi:hypothetical protein GCM10010833_13750 [Blastomonas aquatica]|uniref:Uncharacterized protein n=1 Tax=Blastomonas aquatica TaxID=1510276 RepID=A0ABQ1J811_9SPHN|nr:hypothetical protein GCM10010833_13750 [Blastomonas aquatica]